MYSTPTVSLPVEMTLVASPCPARMRTSGTQITLRNSRSAMLFWGRVSSAPSGSKFIESSSRRCCSARWMHLARHAQIALVAACARLRCRGPRASPGRSPARSSRNPRSAPVMASAVSTTRASTSSIEKELCSVRARSRIARSFAEIAADAGGTAAFSAAPTVPSAASIPRRRAQTGADRNPARRIRCGRSSAACCRVTRLPLTNVPCRLPQSSSMYSPFSTRMRAWTRETRLSRRIRWFSGWRPMRNGTGSTGTRVR